MIKFCMEVLNQCRIFLSNSKPKVFQKVNEKLFPEASIRCTFEDSRMPVKMKKHGFYKFASHCLAN